MLDDGHFGALGHGADEALAAAGHAQIHVLREREQFLNGLAVGGGHDLDGVFGKGWQGALAGFDHDPGDGQVGVEGFLAAAQDGGVAGLEAEAGGVGGDVGARFVDDDDDADGGADLLQLQAVGADAFVQHPADRVGQGGDFAQALGHGGDAFVVELEAVEHGGGEAQARAGFHVAGVGVFDGGAALFEGVGHGEQAGVLVGGGQSGQLARGRFGLPGKLGHLLGQRHGGTVSQIWRTEKVK